MSKERSGGEETEREAAGIGEAVGTRSCGRRSRGRREMREEEQEKTIKGRGKEDEEIRAGTEETEERKKTAEGIGRAAGKRRGK